VRGRPPKLPDKLSRARDARRQRPWIELEGGPVPPPRLRGARSLRPETRAWWQAWRLRGIELGFIATDWQTLQMLVLLVDEFHRTRDARQRGRLAGEIRRNENRLDKERRA
jgi:hypothetical protein